MAEATLTDLTNRLDRLERANRRWKVVGSIVAATLATVTVLNLVLLVGTTRSLVRAITGTESAEQDAESEEAAVEEKIVAKRFILVDDDGTARAVLAIRPDGTPALAFSGKDGKIVWKAP